ncbi:hypothetical protein EMIHUDRAFT_248991 [Emiliania huxleyi CCMP1516]|uniref:Uncharacterized protein n=2 Tax=Emiliania huxleyi TaxID=2903 RepID=A0A0D3IBT1_EMIH1|nr:hypothetical protein EMIHUDRAFT_221474 [Emiliania huxleyi CCMP1516]XP_005761145.1 hypothetical protein EMIHUDRAFT_248991 [Emiliania huxleyi CCMP1516]EOD04054.1 hypothetical protein EMIHUDRAFT_221474 [Emiliania huxleyi CCMP1516]EOD08716.1 hypothetical protein EMIHUDRAFT_248991 [Emiliania huxleyi CCMP1516]|eukprot:XP_005756483.1 hypothetical protein EMIHUDRAFT_221474 [Emiliania huxleyi CCMP1516]
MLAIAVACLGLPAPVLVEPELADSRSVRDGATSDSTVTLIPDTLESTSLELCAPPGGLTVFSEAALHPSCSSTSVGFEVAGSVSANGASTLTMSVGSEPWVPLPNLLSNFMMLVLTGELTLDGDIGVSFELTAPATFPLVRAGVAPFKNLLPGFTTPECEADSGSTG